MAQAPGHCKTLVPGGRGPFAIGARVDHGDVPRWPRRRSFAGRVIRPPSVFERDSGGWWVNDPPDEGHRVATKDGRPGTRSGVPGRGTESCVRSGPRRSILSRTRGPRRRLRLTEAAEDDHVDESLMNRTEPSPKRQLAPPGWKLKISSLAARRCCRPVPRMPGGGARGVSFIRRNLLLIEPETPKAAVGLGPSPVAELPRPLSVGTVDVDCRPASG